MHLPARPGAGFAHGGDKLFPIFIISEGGFAPVASARHMINGSRIFNSQLADHAHHNLRRQSVVSYQYQELTL
jgi:hypothetical protein